MEIRENKREAKIEFLDGKIFDAFAFCRVKKNRILELVVNSLGVFTFA